MKTLLLLSATIVLLFSTSISTAQGTLQAGSAEADTTNQDLTPIGELTRGAQVTIQGTVTRILDEDEFRMEDETGSVRVYIGWRNQVVVDVDETVTVTGIVDDDLVGVFRPEVYARELVREDGTAVELQ